MLQRTAESIRDIQKFNQNVRFIRLDQNHQIVVICRFSTIVQHIRLATILKMLKIWDTTNDKSAIQMHKINPYQKPGSTDPEFIIQKETAITSIQADCNQMSSQSHVTEIQRRRRKAYQRMWWSWLCTIYSPTRRRLKTCKCVAIRITIAVVGSVGVLNAKIWILKGTRKKKLTSADSARIIS